MKISNQKREPSNGMLQRSETVVFFHREEVGAFIHVEKRSRKFVFQQLRSTFKHLLNILENNLNPRYEIEISVRNKNGEIVWTKVEALCNDDLKRIGTNEFLEVVDAVFMKRGSAKRIDVRIWR